MTSKEEKIKLCVDVVNKYTKEIDKHLRALDEIHKKLEKELTPIVQD